jgi:putative nucleotidyltransferase-like protein
VKRVRTSQEPATITLILHSRPEPVVTIASTALKLDSYGPPEVALLLAASRGDPSSESVRRLMAAKLDWAELTRLAVDSHATLGLWEVVSTFPNLPEEADQLQSLAVVNDFRRYHIRSLLARVSKELSKEGIEVLALKGAAMLAGGVAKPSPRTMSDIDILVVQGSPERAWQVCRSNGWTMVDEAWTEDLYRDHHHLPPLLDPDGVSIGLEIHRYLLAGVDRLELDTLAILRRSRIVHVGDVPVRVPSVEDLLLHACLHFAWSNKLRRGAWRAYADVHAILADPSFSWERFVSLATSRRVRQCCYWTLRLGRAVADLRVPDDVLARLDSSAGGRLADMLEHHFAIQIVDPAAEESVAQRARRWLWFAAMQERSTSSEADQLWNEGALELPGEGGSPARAPRGAFRAAISTCGYFARLVSRG